MKLIALVFALAVIATCNGQITKRPYNAAIYYVKVVDTATTTPTTATTTTATTTTATTTTATTTTATTTVATTTEPTTTPTTTTPTTTTPTTTTPTTTTPTTTTPTTTTPTTTPPTTPDTTTTTPTTTTPTTTPPTTPDPTTTTPTTTMTTTTMDIRGGGDDEPKNYHVRHPRSVNGREETWSYVHVCSGTFVSDNDVLTTASCVNTIENMDGYTYIAVTDADTTNALPTTNTKFYVVKGTHKLGSYQEAVNKYNLALLRLHDSVTSTATVSPVFWHTTKPTVADTTKCGYSWWAKDGTQMFQNATLVACLTGNDDLVCATGITTAAACPDGSNGGALVCDDKIAGVFSAKVAASCSTATREFADVAQHEQWMWAVVSGVPSVSVSFLSFGAVVMAVIVNAL